MQTHTLNWELFYLVLQQLFPGLAAYLRCENMLKSFSLVFLTVSLMMIKYTHHLFILLIRSLPFTASDFYLHFSSFFLIWTYPYYALHCFSLKTIGTFCLMLISLADILLLDFISTEVSFCASTVPVYIYCSNIESTESFYALRFVVLYTRSLVYALAFPSEFCVFDHTDRAQ